MGTYNPPRVGAINSFYAPGHYVNVCPVRDTFSTAGLGADQVTIVPYNPGVGFSISEIIGAFSATAGLGNIRSVIYSATDGGMPNQLLAFSPDVAILAPGTFITQLNFTFSAGSRYWLGFHASATNTIRIAADGSPIVATTSADPLTIVTSYYMTQPFANGAPDTFISSGTSSAALIKLRQV